MKKDVLRGTMEGFMKDMKLPVVTHYGVYCLMKKHFFVEFDLDDMLCVSSQDGNILELVCRRTPKGSLWSLSVTDTENDKQKLIWTQERLGKKLQDPVLY